MTDKGLIIAATILAAAILTATGVRSYMSRYHIQLQNDSTFGYRLNKATGEIAVIRIDQYAVCKQVDSIRPR